MVRSPNGRFFPAGASVPAGLETPFFHLEPLTEAHTALDYAALMESREMLRLWSGSTWPQEGFSLADNRQDLARHAREHRERIAFTYTVLDPGRERCLGCVYILSLARLVATQAARPVPAVAVGDFEAAVRFWVTAPLLAQALDQRLLTSLMKWFARDWPFQQLFFHTRAANKQQLHLFEAAGLVDHFTLSINQRGGVHHFWSGAQPD